MVANGHLIILCREIWTGGSHSSLYCIEKEIGIRLLSLLCDSVIKSWAAFTLQEKC